MSAKTLREERICSGWLVRLDQSGREGYVECWGRASVVCRLLCSYRGIRVSRFLISLLHFIVEQMPALKVVFGSDWARHRGCVAL